MYNIGCPPPSNLKGDKMSYRNLVGYRNIKHAQEGGVCLCVGGGGGGKSLDLNILL